MLGNSFLKLHVQQALVSVLQPLYFRGTQQAIFFENPPVFFPDYEVDKPKSEKYGSTGHTVANGADSKVEHSETGISYYFQLARTQKEIVLHCYIWFDLLAAQKSDTKEDDEDRIDWGVAGLPLGVEELTDDERHRMRYIFIFNEEI